MALKPSSILLLLTLIHIFLMISGVSCKKMNLVFYVQEKAGGPNATEQISGGVNGSSSDLQAFGTVFVIDNVITEGSNPNSKVLGRLQGIEANSDLNGKNYHLGASVVLENRGTLEIQGSIRTEIAKRELSVVGGTGEFRFAHGFVIVEVVVVEGVSLTFKFNVRVRA